MKLLTASEAHNLSFKGWQNYEKKKLKWILDDIKRETKYGSYVSGPYNIRDIKKNPKIEQALIALGYTIKKYDDEYYIHW